MWLPILPNCPKSSLLQTQIWHRLRMASVLQHPDPIMLRRWQSIVLGGFWSTVHVFLELKVFMQLVPILRSWQLQPQRELAVLTCHMCCKADQQLHLVCELMHLQTTAVIPSGPHIVVLISCRSVPLQLAVCYNPRAELRFSHITCAALQMSHQT